MACFQKELGFYFSKDVGLVTIVQYAEFEVITQYILIDPISALSK